MDMKLLVLALLAVFWIPSVAAANKRHRKTTKKSSVPKAPEGYTFIHHQLPWKEISKKSLISHGVQPTESTQKQKRGFLANLASLLNDADAISGHHDEAQSNAVTSLSLRPQTSSLFEHTDSIVHIPNVETPTHSVTTTEKKDNIDPTSMSDISKAVKESGTDFAPVFAMYHGKVVELGKLPESAFKKTHVTEHETKHEMKDVNASKRNLDNNSKHISIETTPTRRDSSLTTTSNGDQLKSYLKNLNGDDQQKTTVAKDSISLPELSNVASKNDLINHVKGVVLDDGKVISVNGANHVADNADAVKQPAETVPEVAQKFVVNSEGNVEPLIKQKPVTVDAVARDTVGDGQKTVTLTVDVLKELLKKTDSKVSLAQLLNKPAAEERSNTQEDEDPGTIEDFAAGGLKAHNEYRGKHHDDNLIWSDDLASKAQKLAETLADKKTLEIAKDLEKEGLGENVAKVWATFKNAGEAACKMWYQQSENYKFDDPHLDENTGQFAQVVWKSTRELGMGVAKSIDDVNNKYVYVTALYRPPGNIEAQMRNNVLPTGNNTQDVYSTFFKRAKVVDHTPVEKRSKVYKRRKQSQKKVKVEG